MHLNFVEINPQKEFEEQGIAEQIVNLFFTAGCASIEERNGELWGFFLRLQDQPVKGLVDMLEILNDETVGETYCNNIIGGFSKDTAIDPEVLKAAINQQTTSLTFEVAAALGKRLREVLQLSPDEQWTAVAENAQSYYLQYPKK